MRMLFIFLLFFIEVAIADDQLEFNDAWVREAPPSAKILAAYGQLKNSSKKAIRIVSISSEAFEKVEIHLTTLNKGMMHMQEMHLIDLKPNESIIFKPNGRHLMLIKPQMKLRHGDTVPIVMKVQSGKVFSFHVEVKR